MTRRMESYVDRVLADFPAERYSASLMKAIRQKHRHLGVAFAPCGVDAEDCLIIASDDGTVYATDLRTADPEEKRIGVSRTWKLNAEAELIGREQFPDEYMLGRDTSDWLWVHPQWRYLTAEDGDSS